MSNQFPQILYKYRSYDERTIKMLEKNEVYFAHPSKFNDPFDCGAKEITHQIFRENMVRHCIALRQNIQPEFVTKEQVKFLLEKIANIPELINVGNESKYLLGKLFSLGVLSLSESNDSILMWSHYADSHRGMCLGFINNFDVSAHDIKKVTYSEKINTDFLFKFFQGLEISEENFEEELQKELFLKKYIDWKCEKEWRILSKEGLQTYSGPCLDRIIFGLNMPQNHKEYIKSKFKDRKIKFFETQKNKIGFTLEINQID